MRTHILSLIAFSLLSQSMWAGESSKSLGGVIGFPNRDRLVCDKEKMSSSQDQHFRSKDVKIEFKKGWGRLTLVNIQVNDKVLMNYYCPTKKCNTSEIQHDVAWALHISDSEWLPYNKILVNTHWSYDPSHPESMPFCIAQEGEPTPPGKPRGHTGFDDLNDLGYLGRVSKALR
jgi:hypothetical protein